ncbi:uncharacterized protein LOC122388463 [Amphibalanus amphitrite]|uniref:uncharacterized protein LOC122388463 n=1 Tax=Amphibalanus amphitrite TaxID=1232801 RepID=UPI001C919F0E|nr:uncharacterized protein LOC122388463 [Amphibalanus amphitrite]
MRPLRRRLALSLLLTGVGTLFVLNSFERRQPWSEEPLRGGGRPPVVFSPAPLHPPSLHSVVVRHSTGAPTEAPSADLRAMVLTEYVMEETQPGSGVWRASAWNDTQFSAAELALLRGITAWLQSASGRCDRLQMLGAPRRSGNGVRPELPVCADPPTVAGGRRTPCLVYQLGIAGGDWTFAEQMARRDCHVFVLDHRERAEPEGEHSYHVLFRRLGVGRTTYVASGGLVLTLDGLMRELNHTQHQVHYLRSDLGGLETEMLFDQLLDPKSRRRRRFVLDRVDQMSLRLQLRSRVERELTFYRMLGSALRQLELLGFELVHSAPLAAGDLWKFPGREQPMALIHDVLLVRKRPPARDFSANMVL